jgi:hypothetical protein
MTIGSPARIEVYAQRFAQFLGSTNLSGWRLKRYSLNVTDAPVALGFLTSALEIASAALPLPPVTDDRYGVGILIAHQGHEGRYVLVQWWSYGSILCQNIFMSPPSGDAPFRPMGEFDEAATLCVWELAIVGQERQAWITHMMQPAANYDAYLMDGYTGPV